MVLLKICPGSQKKKEQMKDVMVTNILLLVKKPLELLLQKWKRTKRHKTKRNKASNRTKKCESFSVISYSREACLLHYCHLSKEKS